MRVVRQTMMEVKETAVAVAGACRFAMTTTATKTTGTKTGS
jgi:hypothetical protein